MKCCGSAGSNEDLIRYAEAGAINAAFAEAVTDVRGTLGRDIDAAIIGGDLNLVGTRGPLDILRTGLASDGSDFEPASTGVIGTPRSTRGATTGASSVPAGSTGS